MPATDELDLGTTFSVEIGGDAAQANVYLASGLPCALIDLTAARTFPCDFILRLTLILLAKPMILIGSQRSLQVTGRPHALRAILALVSSMGFMITSAIASGDQAARDRGRLPFDHAVVAAATRWPIPVSLIKLTTTPGLIPTIQSRGVLFGPRPRS